MLRILAVVRWGIDTAVVRMAGPPAHPGPIAGPGAVVAPSGMPFPCSRPEGPGLRWRAKD